MTDPTAASTGSPAAAGRPRDASADRQILQAAFRLLVAHGYGGMSIEGVAAAAGVAKTTVYRRYPAKRDLVVAALAFGAPFEPVLTPDLPTRDALRVFVRAARAGLVDSGAFRAMGSLLVEQEREPELLATFRDRVLFPRLGRLRDLLERGIARAEVRPDVDPLMVVEMAGGAMFGHHAVLGLHGDDTWADRLADHLWAAVRRT
jgi:AcrR family transcriptional regulator